MEQQKNYQAALYCRLSQDDGTTGDSSSIQTQKLILEAYCREHEYTIHDFYVDDGYSGTNFERPDFKRMIGDVESGKVNLVITKDLSRFGRDYIMAGYYTEIYFSDKGVRYIAINDNVDTAKADNDIAPFKNILNDMYARDLSRKIRASLRQRALQGKFLGCDAPYGYKRNPDDKNKLLIEPETAGVVRRIFSLALSGYGAIYIARLLTQEKILTPAAYKLKAGNPRFQMYVEEGQECRWSDGKVHKILVDPTYIGAVVNGRTHKNNYKAKKNVWHSRDKWIIVPNMHEAIITQEEFDRAQELGKYRKLPRPKTNVENLFRGLVKCSVCGKSMILTTQLRKGKLMVYYRCNSFVSIRAKEKHWTTIKYEDIKEAVTARLKEYLSALKDDDKLIEFIRKTLKDTKATVNYEKELAKIDTRQAALSNITKKVYDDYFEGLISKDTYLDLIRKYQSEESSLKSKREFLLIEQNKKDDRSEDIVASFLDLKVLRQEMVFNLIDKIEVLNAGDYKQHKKREIKITYLFSKPEGISDTVYMGENAEQAFCSTPNLGV